MHKHIYECASCSHTPTHVQSAYILYTQTNRKRRIRWVNHIEKTIPRSGNSRWTGPGMGRGWHKENSSKQATVAGMDLVRDRNGSFCLLFCHQKKMPWKFLLKKIIYQIILLIMVRLGNTVEWTRSNLGGWKILEPLKLLTVHYKAAESMKITKHGFLTRWCHPNSTTLSYGVRRLLLLRVSSPGRLLPPRGLYTWPEIVNSFLSARAGSVTLTLILSGDEWELEFFNTKVYRKHMFEKPHLVHSNLLSLCNLEKSNM